MRVVIVRFGRLYIDIYSSELAQSDLDLDTSTLVPFPPFDGSKFCRLVDQEMGFEL